MPFYFRKSVSAGPFRFNFSKGGVGVSVGVRGLRIGTGPRGHYIHAGRGGFYYRTTLGRAGERTPTPPESAQLHVDSYHQADGVQMIEIESGDVLGMRDERLDDLLSEVNAKQQQLRLATVLAWSMAGLGLLAMLFSSGIGLVVMLCGFVGYGIGAWLDSFRRTAVLFYDLDEHVAQAYEALTGAFDQLASCQAKWHVKAAGAIKDLTAWKRNAGAARLVDKSPIQLTYALPSVIKANLTPPAIPVGKQTLFLLPDMILVVEKERIGAIGYDKLQARWQDSNFIEEGSVPRDARVIGQTWKHPNKSGGPDRRFSNNYQIPVCLYEVLHLSSSSGLNELLEFSRTGVSQHFGKAVGGLAGLTVASRSQQPERALPAV